MSHIRNEVIESLRQLFLALGALPIDYVGEYDEVAANSVYYDGELDLGEIADTVLDVVNARQDRV